MGYEDNGAQLKSLFDEIKRQQELTPIDNKVRAVALKALEECIVDDPEFVTELKRLEEERLRSK